VNYRIASSARCSFRRVGAGSAAGLEADGEAERESDPRTFADADREHILETLNQTNWLIGEQGGEPAWVAAHYADL
jgi:hypothetical protein